MKCLINSCLIIFLIFALLLGVAIFSPKASDIVKSLPQYPNSTFLSTFQTSYPDDYPSDGITYTTTDDPEQLLDFYRQELPKQGWVLERETEAAGGQHQGSLYFTKKRCSICLKKNWRLILHVVKPDSLDEKPVDFIISIRLEKR